MKFNYYLLRDLVNIKYGKDQKNVASDKGQYPIYGTGGLIGHATKFLYDKPSVLIGRKGTIDRVKYVEKPFWTVDTLFYTEINTEKVLPKYLFYLMSNIDLKQYNEGTTIPSLRTETLYRLEFRIPPLPIQKKIAAVLSALDDKIELNNKINQNLEQQAQAIFKSWFIDFEPFGGKMPDDWKKGKLKDILRLKKKSIKPKENKLPYLPIDIIPMHNLALKEFKSHSEAKSSLITFDKDDILIGAMRVYFHRVVIAPCKGVTRTTCFVLSPFNNNCLIYGLMLCNQNEAIKYAQKTSKGSTMPYAIWDGGLGDLKIIIPSQKILNDFNTSLLPCIKKIQNSYFENLRLAQLRDALLPKLMSGEIDVSKINIDDFENKILGEKND